MWGYSSRGPWSLVKSNSSKERGITSPRPSAKKKKGNTAGLLTEPIYGYDTKLRSSIRPKGASVGWFFGPKTRLNFSKPTRFQLSDLSPLMGSGEPQVTFFMGTHSSAPTPITSILTMKCTIKALHLSQALSALRVLVNLQLSEPHLRGRSSLTSSTHVVPLDLCAVLPNRCDTRRLRDARRTLG